MSNQAAASEDDWTTLILMLMVAFASGIVSLGMFVDPLRDWMLQYHLLEQGDGAVLPLVDGVGFGWGQILVIAALLITGVAFIVWLKRRAATRV